MKSPNIQIEFVLNLESFQVISKIINFVLSVRKEVFDYGDIHISFSEISKTYVLYNDDGLFFTCSSTGDNVFTCYYDEVIGSEQEFADYNTAIEHYQIYREVFSKMQEDEYVGYIARRAQREQRI